MGLGWMDVSDISFNSLLLLERIQIKWLSMGHVPEKELGIAIKANPTVEWYLRNKCKEVGGWLDSILQDIDEDIINDKTKVRECEETVLKAINDWIVYVVDPSVYDQQTFVNWDSQELLSLVDFKGKTVIDVGAGTGRLTFTVAKEAKTIYAVEPIENMRKYIRERAKKESLANIYVIDGLIEAITLQDEIADVTMGGHVFGDYFDEEYNELMRVTKTGGMIILCPGNNDIDNERHEFLVNKGFEWSRFEEPGDGIKRKYWKVKK